MQYSSSLFFFGRFLASSRCEAALFGGSVFCNFLLHKKLQNTAYGAPPAANALTLRVLKFSILWGTIFWIAISSGCNFFFDTQEIALILPSEPQEIFNNTIPQTWKIQWLTDFNQLEEQRIVGMESTYITVAKEIPLIVAAWPETIGPPKKWRFHPAGFVAGADAISTSIQLTWPDGFASQSLLELASRGVNMQDFNVSRFRAAIEERAIDKPWNMDQRSIISDIIHGEFWIYSLKPLEGIEVHLSLLEGNWYTPYPLDSPLVISATGWNGVLPKGMNHFLRIQDDTMASVWVENESEVSILLTLPDSGL